ncbi:MAG: TonB-dependent receptor [Sulfuricella denitrificans]|nr:TonB-dependent receptor [Sulfuricella denitrificans]
MPNTFLKLTPSLLGSTLLIYAGAASGTESVSSEGAYLDEMPVVLSVSRLAQRVDEAPAAVTIIDREMIRDSGAWDLSEVMRLVPGMYVAYHAARYYSTDSIVGYHGLMSETMSHRMQVLVDGRSVYSPLYGGVIWSDIPVVLDDIDRIEVVRGPNAASYGANSFIGVINIITRHSAVSQGKHVSFSAGRGREEAVASYGGKSGDTTYRITASARNDQGEAADINNPDLKGSPSSLYGWTKNKFDDKQVRMLNFRADHQINSSDALEFQFGYNGGLRQSGEVNGWHSPDKQADNHFAKLNWRRALVGGGELSVQFYHMVESSTAQLINTDPEPGLFNATSNGDVTLQRNDLEIQHTFAPSSNTRLVWGGSVRRDTTYAPHELGSLGLTPNPPRPDVYDTLSFDLSRLFGNLEWHARPDLIFNFGAMAENNSYTGTDITPRLAANWHFLPGHTLRISQSQATRTPSVFEKAWEIYQRVERNHPDLPVLTPEKVNTSDIGYLGKFNALDVDFRLFYEEYTSLIADRRNDAANNGNLNSGRATVKGVETQLKWKIGPRTKLIYSLSNADTSSSDVDRITYSYSVPVNNQSLMLTHSFDSHWRASTTVYKTDKTHFDRTDYDLNQGRGYFIAPVRRWDARVAYTFQTGGTHGELALIVQNIENAQYFEFRHDNQVPGRSAWMNLKLDF